MVTKMYAVLILGVSLIGVGATVLRYQALAGEDPGAPALPAAFADDDKPKEQPELAKLKQENERLRKELEQTRELLARYQKALNEQKAQADLARVEAQAPRDNPPADRVRQAANRAKSSNNLKQLLIAMHNYHDANGLFPTAAIRSKDGKPLLSWRVTLLPYLEHDQLYKQFHLDEPWDSEHNKKLLAKMPKVFAPVGVKTKEPNTTFYQVFTGKGTLFDGNRGIRIAEVTDGLSNTILMAEAGEPVPWTKPQDMAFDADKPLPKLGGEFDGNFFIAFADGSVRFVKKKFDEKILRAALTRAGGEVLDLDNLDR